MTRWAYAQQLVFQDALRRDLLRNDGHLTEAPHSKDRFKTPYGVTFFGTLFVVAIIVVLQGVVSRRPTA